jgi:hypothetical protein
MGNTRNRHPARRRFLKQSAALTAQATMLTAPAVAIAKVAGDSRAADATADSLRHERPQPAPLAPPSTADAGKGLPPSPASAGEGLGVRAKARP